MTDEQVRWIALFYLFSFMDEKTAIEASQRTIASLKTRLGASGHADSLKKSLLIRTLSKTFHDFRKQNPRNRSVSLPETSWIKVDKADLENWSRFQMDSSDGEVIAVALSKVLSFSDEEIAEGLNLSIGTVRYRVGKGVRQLGMVRKVKG